MWVLLLLTLYPGHPTVQIAGEFPDLPECARAEHALRNVTHLRTTNGEYVRVRYDCVFEGGGKEK